MELDLRNCISGILRIGLTGHHFENIVKVSKLVRPHTRSVKSFAKVPGTSRLRPWCTVNGQPRQNFPIAQAVSTEVLGVKIQRAAQPSTARLSQVMWLYSDLKKEFGS